MGALLLLLAGAVLIWAVSRKTGIATEAVLGVTFSVALAIGGAITRGEELLDALFGSAGALSPWEIVLGLGAPVAVILFVIRFRNALIVSMISPEIALTSQIDVARVVTSCWPLL